MRKYGTGKRQKPFDKSTKFKKNKPRWFHIDEEILTLKKNYSEVEARSLKSFKEIPLSAKTQKGLDHGKYQSPTDIQRESIILALQENDILGAAKTGSGKTLAFLIPVLECLYKAKWTQLDGLGALIISPTRELAYQIFEVLRIVGKFHDFSAGLVIGGKHLREEAERINRTNVVICTPGRLLQHMDETVNFNADNLQILVLDEADRILDMGFQQSMNAIIDNLPSKRQTLLFSATQTKSVKDLARLSLNNPMYVSAHEHSKHSTPTQLQQNFIVCDLHEKLDVLWSFIKNHLKKKVLVFLSSCKQVRFVYEVFRKLRPGITVLSLHGAMQQMKRVAMYESFCRKQNAVLFATDIAARGLDFPAVHWVVQLDCPEDANTYIHRAGRTARYEKNGESLLILEPAEEEAMIKQLADKKIPINRIRVNTKKMSSIQPKMESLCASDIQIKEFAQRAFVSYLKSVFFMKNKAVFDIKKLDTDSFARCLGLAIPPRIRFLQKTMKNKIQNEKIKSDSIEQEILVSKKDKLKGKTNDSEQNDDSSAESDNDIESIPTDDISDHKMDSASKPNKTSITNVQSETESESISSSEESSDGISDNSNSNSDSSDNEEKNSSLVQKKTKSKDREKLTTKKEVFSFKVDEEDDDLLTVKQIRSLDSDSESDISDIDDVRQRNKKGKLKTKAATAKKILKKNLKVNTKVVFDEDGQEVIDVLKKPQNVETDDDITPGINIKEARKRMEEADKLDKEIFRKNIKKKKLEKKIKEKMKKRSEAERRQQKEEEPQVMLGSAADDFNSEDEDHFGSDREEQHVSGSDQEEQGGSGQSSDESDQGQESCSDEMDQSVSSGPEAADRDGSDSSGTENRLKSAKRKGQDTKRTKNIKRLKKETEEFDTGLSLQDDEELALKLLLK